MWWTVLDATTDQLGPTRLARLGHDGLPPTIPNDAGQSHDLPLRLVRDDMLQLTDREPLIC
jgi:hypothetical protein